MLDCRHKFRVRSHKISTPCKISTPSSKYGFSHDLHVFFFAVHVEKTTRHEEQEACLPTRVVGAMYVAPTNAAGMKIEYERV